MINYQLSIRENKLLMAWAMGALLFRVLLSCLMYVGFGGKEYTDDITMHLRLASEPFAYFICEAGELSQHPPLLGLLEMPLIFFTEMVGPFFGPRLGYALWDISGCILLAHALRTLISHDQKLWLYFLIFMGPINIYASTVSAQDEVITFFCASVCAVALLNKKVGWTFVGACFATVAAKIFFVALAMLVVPSLIKHKAWGALVAGSLLLVVPHLVGITCDYSGSRYVLSAAHTVNIWQYFVTGSNIPTTVSFYTSLLLFFLVTATFLTLIWYKPMTQWFIGFDSRIKLPDAAPSALIIYFIFMALGYHVVPEYLLLVVPIIILYLLSAGVDLRWQYLIVGIILPWSIVPDVLRYFVRYKLGPLWLQEIHWLFCALVTLQCLIYAIMILRLELTNKTKLDKAT